MKRDFINRNKPEKVMNNPNVKMIVGGVFHAFLLEGSKIAF
jgi:hypothetical protein